MFDAKKLKERRLEKGLTQADVYEDLKISRKTYSSWENGLAEPHEKNLRRLAKRLSVKEDYFIQKKQKPLSAMIDGPKIDSYILERM